MIRHISERGFDKHRSGIEHLLMDGQTYNSPRVSELQYTANGDSAGSLPTLKYSYDAIGNITKVTAGSEELAAYQYDVQNQLISERTRERTSSYVYDTYGNILSKTDNYPDFGKSQSYTFTYGEGCWKDLLKAVTYKPADGPEITLGLKYDAIGNPIEYFNGNREWYFDWTNGRQLSKALRFVNDGEEIRVTNTYDVDGIRESKMVGGILHGYVTLDGKVVMYYLNSRFYDPAICRFINADSGISGNGEELLGYNMFTYCFWNAVEM